MTINFVNCPRQQREHRQQYYAASTAGAGAGGNKDPIGTTNPPARNELMLPSNYFSLMQGVDAWMKVNLERCRFTVVHSPMRQIQ